MSDIIRYGIHVENLVTAEEAGEPIVHLYLSLNDYQAFAAAVDALPRPDAVEALRRLFQDFYSVGAHSMTASRRRAYGWWPWTLN